MTDFGSEESFGQAAKGFEEHYGWSIDRAKVRREVEKTAQKAQQYMETRLSTAVWDHFQPLCIRPGVEQILVELDGSHIRTGTKVAIEGAKLAKKRRLRQRARQLGWGEVRVGLARPLSKRSQRTYVAQMSKHPEV